MQQDQPCNVTVSVRHRDNAIYLTRIREDPQGRCFEAESQIILDAEKAHGLLRGLQWALEHVGYFPTDEQFEEYRTRVLEDLDEVAME